MRSRIAALEQKVDRLESLVDAQSVTSDAGAGLDLKCLQRMPPMMDAASSQCWVVSGTLLLCYAQTDLQGGAAACLLRTCVEQ
jgi:hypothetical protein